MKGRACAGAVLRLRPWLGACAHPDSKRFTIYIKLIEVASSSFFFFFLGGEFKGRKKLVYGSLELRQKGIAPYLPDHAGGRILYYEAHEAPRLHCLSSKAHDTAEHHGRCSLSGVHALTWAGVATTRVGGDRSRPQRQVAVAGGGGVG